MISAPGRYKNLAPRADLVYRALCLALSGREEMVDWGAFTAAEWDLLPRMADLEGVGPLLYWQFKKDGWPDGCPAQAAAGLVRQYFQTLNQNQHMLQELGRIQAAFQEAGLKLVLLKGAAMAQCCYEDIGLRPMGDLDLLLEKDFLEAGAAALRSLGYAPDKPRLRSHHLLTNELNFVSGGKIPTIVELHWNLVGPDGVFYGSRLDLFRQDLQPLQLNGSQAFTLRPAAAFLYQAGHLVLKHGEEGQRLLWDYDLARILRSSGGNTWEEATALAQAQGWDPVLSRVAARLEAVFALRLEGDLPRAQGEMSQASRRVAELLESRQGSRRSFGRHFVEVFPGLSRRERLLLLSGVVFPGREFLTWRYQPKAGCLLALCLARHWFSLLGSGVRFLRRRLK